MTDVLSPAPPDASHPAQIGPYEIVGVLGRGGMGTVYRARDPRLHREVAVKVLHASPGGDPRLLQRFLEEARAAGALNHPNILAVYDVAPDAEPPYIVTELIEGVPLRQLLDGGMMPLSRVLDIAVQVADGLAAAHRANLVHRDLKPENVMVTPGGRVKIVDFGLAKPDPGGPAGTRTLTAPHVILGTPLYMSPEQARGAAVDFRSDLFSFGAMLYEMTSDRRAFERPSSIETLSAILHDEPPPLMELTPRAPASLQRIVGRCLAKNPEDRYGATADLHHDLRELRERASALGSSDVVGRRASRLPHRTVLLIVTAVALVAAGVAVASLLLRPAGVDLANYRFVPFATDAAYEGAAAWSPDGRTVAYLAERDGVIQVMLRGLDAFSSTQLTHAVSDCRDPFWSSDGTRVFYVSQAADRDGLWSVGTVGGTPRVELQDVSAATFSPDGRALVFLRDERDETRLKQVLWVSDPFPTEPRRFAGAWPGVATAGISFIRFSPNGRTVALWANSRESEGMAHAIDSADVWLFAYPSGQARRVLRSLGQMTRAHPFAWMPDSRRIVFGADGIGRSPGTHLWIGDTAADRVEPLTMDSTSEYEPSVSPDGGRIAFTSETSGFDLLEMPLDGSAPRQKASLLRALADPSWSPRGRQFAYVTDRSGSPEIWRSDAEGTIEVPVVTAANFTDETYMLSRVVFSPDGERLAYQRRNGEGYAIWMSSVAGGPAFRLLPATTAVYQDAPTWSPDGTWIAFTYLDRTGRWSLGKLRPGVGGDLVTLRQDVITPFSPDWSPDGRWLLCRLADGLYAVAAEGSASRLISREAWLAHTWSKDGSHVFAIRETDENRLALSSVDARTGAERVISADLGPSPATTPPLRGFSLSPDGASILTSIVRLRGDIYLLDGFQRDAGLWPRVRRALGR